MNRIRSLLLAAALIAALTAPAHAQPAQGWTCHKYGAAFWQWHCHY